MWKKEISPVLIKTNAVGIAVTGWGSVAFWLLVPTLAKLFDFPNSIPACLGNVFISLPWSQSLFPPSVQFLFVWARAGVRCLSLLASCLLDFLCQNGSFLWIEDGVLRGHPAVQGPSCPSGQSPLGICQADLWTSQNLSQNSGLSFCYSSCLLLLLTFC